MNDSRPTPTLPVTTEPGFAARHIGPSAAEQAEMLAAIGAPSIDALLDEAIPPAIRRTDPLPLDDAEREHDYLARLWAVASSSSDAVAIGIAVRSLTIVWKLSSDSRRPCAISA